MPRGRPEGSKDKNRQYLWNRLKDMYGDDFDPIIKASEQALVLHAQALEAEENQIMALKASVDAWLKIGEFVTPKLKAMELNIGEDTLKAMKPINHIKDIDHLEATQLYHDSLKARGELLEQ